MQRDAAGRVAQRQVRRRAFGTVEGRKRTGVLMVVTPAIASYLRRGLLTEIGFASDRLSQLTLGGEVTDEHACQAALWMIDAARDVLTKIGYTDPGKPFGVTLSSEDSPFVVYRALKAQLAAAVTRAQDEAAEGRIGRARVDSELTAVVSSLRAYISRSPLARREARMSGSPGDERIIASHAGRSARRS
ncbi:MAG TPA: hypothetical protein VL988_07835 [Solirubrobacteraceae bacterium]|nr:hypothetical protein [Solirubrobacteraceae bacterium]